MSSPQKRWLVCPRKRPGARCRLICFSHAGGGTAMFCRWAGHLPDSIELSAVHMPGRESRLYDPPLTDLHAAAEVIVEHLLPSADVPFAFFGHSLGAHVAFEVVRSLRRRQVPGPCHLFASAARAPQLADPLSPIGHLPDQEFIDKICARFGGVPEEVLNNKELMKMMLIPLRADFEMVDTYSYTEEPPLQCPITVFGGNEDYLERKHLDAWHQQTVADFKLEMFSGSHFFVESHIRDIMRMVSDELLRTGGV